MTAAGHRRLTAHSNALLLQWNYTLQDISPAPENPPATRSVESESPGVRVLTRSRSLSFEEDCDSGPYLSHLCNFVAVYLTFVQLILQH